jgi:hypothetical protein
MAHRRKRRGNGGGAALRQAQLDSQVRYSPEAFALSSLLQQAASDYGQRVKAERGAARGITAAISATVPKTKADYGQALKFGRQQQSTVNRKLAGLSSAADDIKAASAVEAGGAQRRIGEERANAVNELRQRRSQAAAGAAFAVSQAGQEYASKRDTIQNRILELGREQGTFTVAQTEANRKADRQFKLGLRGQNVTKRGQTLSHQDRVKSQKIAARKDRYQRAHGLGPYKPASKPKGAKGPRLTPGQNNAAIDGIGYTLAQIRKLEANPKLTSHTIRQQLEAGIDLPQRKDKNGNVIPGVHVKPQPHDYVNAAYDLYAFGHLSPTNWRRLRHGHHIQLPARWRPRRTGVVGKAGKIVSGISL